MMRSSVVLAVLLGLLASCGPDRGPAPAPAKWTWHPITLPLPDGPPGRVTAKDATGCAGHWYVVGAVTSADNTTRPAAWTSTDGTAWQPLATRARTGYGAENILSAVGCRDGRAAAIGAKSGGAHGNPRVSTWQMTGNAELTEQTAEFVLYGGEEAINVSRVVGGPAGWLIAGNRVSGAAVWTAPDGGGFTLHAGVPALATDAAGTTWASDAVATADGGWTVVGGLTPADRTNRDPVAWRSADGPTWQRERIDGTDANEELHRVVRLGDDLLAVGPRGDTFGAWLRHGGQWRPAGRFGSAAGGSGVPEVRSLAVLDGAAVVVVADGTMRRAYTSRDAATWTELVRPAPDWFPSAVTAGTGRWLVASDDGRVWSAVPPR